MLTLVMSPLRAKRQFARASGVKTNATAITVAGGLAVDGAGDGQDSSVV